MFLRVLAGEFFVGFLAEFADVAFHEGDGEIGDFLAIFEVSSELLRLRSDVRLVDHNGRGVVDLELVLA